MNDELAERLLANIMNWDDEKLSQERRDLEVLATLKYDEYQQFRPGIRFMESLCMWLNQFEFVQRQIAYEFFKYRLVFISNAELNHLIRMAYPDFIEPFLIDRVISVKQQESNYNISEVVASEEFKVLRRKCLFLGLSDGARIDVFRRYSGLDHEQIHATYQFSDDKSKDFLSNLYEYFRQSANYREGRFEIAFLLDDFSGSGQSFIRKRNGEFKGKIVKFVQELSGKKSNLFTEQYEICIILYIATTTAKMHIQSLAHEFLKGKEINLTVIILQELKDFVKLQDSDFDPEFLKMLKDYFDPGIISESYKVGKISAPYLGFDEGRLPLVLPHNCPNNSLPLLWYDPERYQHRGLFPRVERFPGKLENERT